MKYVRHDVHNYFSRFKVSVIVKYFASVDNCAICALTIRKTVSGSRIVAIVYLNDLTYPMKPRLL